MVGHTYVVRRCNWALQLRINMILVNYQHTLNNFKKTIQLRTLLESEKMRLVGIIIYLEFFARYVGH